MAYTWDRYDQDLHRLVVRALRELLTAVTARPNLSPEEFAALAAIVTDKYGRAAAGSALLALENTRLDAGVFDLPRPEIVAPASAAQSMASASWAWNQSRGGALGAAQRFAGPLGKLVRQPARQTVWNASVTAGTRYVRVPGAKACSFCLMLASRGAVYTKETVTATTGKSRKRPEGVKFHDDCNCSARESLTDADLPQIVRDLQDEWYDVTYDDEGRALPNQRQSWDDHIRETRPNHETVRPTTHAQLATFAGDDAIDHLNRQASAVSLSGAEHQAVARWQGTDRFYQEVQRAAGGESNDLHAAQVADSLIAASEKMSLNGNLEMWRGVRNYRTVFGTGELDAIAGREVIQRRFTAVSADRQLAIDQFTDPGKAPALLRVRVREGTPAIWTPVHGRQESDYTRQQELLLPPDVTMRIVGVRELAGRMPEIDVEVYR